MIGDRRSRNYVEARLPGVSACLPSAQCLLDLEVRLPFQRLSLNVTDRKDFYHQLMVTKSRAETNGLYPFISLEDVKGTKAFERWCLSNKGQRAYDRLKEGDYLGERPRKKKAAHKMPSAFQACFASIPQGDHLGVEIATESHRNYLISKGLLQEEEEVRSGLPYLGQKVASGLVIDDFFSISVEDAANGRWPDEKSEWIDTAQAPQGIKQILLARKAYADAGLEGSPLKDLVDEEKGKIIGAEVDSSSLTRSLGLVLVAAPVRKRLALSYISLELAAKDTTSDALHACLIGGWVSAAMYRRPFMSILQKAYKIQMSEVDQERPKTVNLPRSVAEELTLLAVLCPLMASDVSAPLQPRCYATDSSDGKGAVVSAPVSEALSRALCRSGRKKASYARMLSRSEAILKNIDEMYEERPR